MDFFSCHKISKKYTPIQEDKKSSKLKDCQIFIVIKVWGIQRLVFVHFQIENSNFLFYTCIPEKVREYHTGSAFTQP